MDEDPSPSPRFGEVVLLPAACWRPTATEFEEALVNFVSDPDVARRIRRFHKGYTSPDAADPLRHTMPDCKCFLLASVLLRTSFQRAIGPRGAPAPVVNHKRHVDIRRTAEGRPHIGHLGGWFNANVSHAGGAVLLAFVDVPGVVVGCDVMPVELAPPEPITAASVGAFFTVFKNYFTTDEWVWIASPVHFTAETQRHFGDVAFFKLKRFLVLWCLKEALIKAMGIGLGFDLQRASFAIESRNSDVWEEVFFCGGTELGHRRAETERPAAGGTTTILLRLDDQPVPPQQWHFRVYEDRAQSIVGAVALVPVEASKESTLYDTFRPALEGDSLRQRPTDLRTDARLSRFKSFNRVSPEEVLRT